MITLTLTPSPPILQQSLTTHEDDERAILLILKQHWVYPFSLFEQWNSTSSPCDDWPGISCNFNASVIGISLSGMNMRGSFPDSTIICHLKNLVSIDFSSNNLWGTIPANLSTCSKLETLDLSTNDLTGEIAGELFSMKTLRSLNLQCNMLSGEIPTPMLQHLFQLSLSYNKLSGEIPTSRVDYNLEDLDLSNNQLNGSIPGELLSMKRLSRLYLQYNMLSGEIPTPIAAYNLEYLDLSSNHLNGSIPEDIWSSYNLIRLDLSNNSLKGPIPVVLLLLQLSHLSLSYNKLIGEIPAGLFALPSLSSIDLSHNHLRGIIPKGFGELLQLRATTTLAICFNNISGRIPYKLVNERFENSCFDEANLCSDVKEKGLPACSTDWCSDDTIRGYLDCSSKSKRKSNYIIITCGAIAGIILIGLGILILVLRPRVGRRRESDGEEWSMISFQRLKFNKWDILGGLIDENLIGNGGSGKVYRVITKIGQNVAVKSIRHEQKERQGLMEKQFLAEVNILGGIWHNNIVKLLCCIRGKTTKLLVTRKVDAKSDVYSFGVVLLELTTGREAVTGNEYMNLAQWAHKHQREGKSAADVLDEEIKEPSYLEAMITVFKLGLACTLSSPSSRPSMKDVSQILQRCNGNNHMSLES
nr:systemin receptor SR160-like [Ipomoea batatas]